MTKRINTEDSGFPGEFPFRRGIYPSMYRGRLWSMRQYAGFGSAESTNERFHYLLKQGQGALSTAFDLPTQMGYDSDHSMARSEVGRVGVAIDSIDDMERLFRNIDLSSVSTSMTINSTAAILLALYQSVADKGGADCATLRGTVQNDLLKEFVARGTYMIPPRPSMRLVVDIIEYCSQRLPQWYPISVSGYHMREAGATAAQELAFTLANGCQYLRSCQERGLDVRSLCRRLSFFFSVDNNFLEEVAKFRAARVIWAQLLHKQFKIPKEDSRALALRFHAQTGGSTLTAQQPHNNIIRVTMQAMAAVLGGAQSLHTNSFDEALALPTQNSALLALRTQQIIAYESEVTNTIDPVAGSESIEAETERLIEEGRTLINTIDDMGGALVAVESQWMQEAIAESSYQQQRFQESGERVVVGVNRFESDTKVDIPLTAIDPTLGDQQAKRLETLRAQRQKTKHSRALDGLKKAIANEQVNLLPALVEAVEARATVGELSALLTDHYGRFTGT